MDVLSELQTVIARNLERHQKSQCYVRDSLQSSSTNTSTFSSTSSRQKSIGHSPTNKPELFNRRNLVPTRSFDPSDDLSEISSLFQSAIFDDESVGSKSKPLRISRKKRKFIHKLKSLCEDSNFKNGKGDDRAIEQLLKEYLGAVNPEIHSVVTHDCDNSTTIDLRKQYLNILLKEVEDSSLPLRPQSPELSKVNTPRKKTRQLTMLAQKIETEPKSVTPPPKTVSFDEWKSTIMSADETHELISQYIELKYLQVKERERFHGREGSKDKIAIIAEILLKLCGSMSKHSIVLTELVYELLNCVFMEYTTSKNRFTLNQTLNDLSTLKTYSEEFLNQCEEMEDLQQEIDWIKQGVQMKNIVKKFQCVRLVFDPASRFLRDTCFNLWKKLYVTHDSYRVVQVRKALRYRLLVWKEWMRNKYKIRRRSMQFDAVNKKIIMDERHQQEQEQLSDNGSTNDTNTTSDKNNITDVTAAAAAADAAAITATGDGTLLSGDSEDDEEDEDQEVMDLAQSLNEKLERISELQSAIERRSSFMVDSAPSPADKMMFSVGTGGAMHDVVTASGGQLKLPPPLDLKPHSATRNSCHALLRKSLTPHATTPSPTINAVSHQKDNLSPEPVTESTFGSPLARNTFSRDGTSRRLKRKSSENLTKKIAYLQRDRDAKMDVVNTQLLRISSFMNADFAAEAIANLANQIETQNANGAMSPQCFSRGSTPGQHSASNSRMFSSRESSRLSRDSSVLEQKLSFVAQSSDQRHSMFTGPKTKLVVSTQSPSHWIGLPRDNTDDAVTPTAAVPTEAPAPAVVENDNDSRMLSIVNPSDCDQLTDRLESADCTPRAPPIAALTLPTGANHSSSRLLAACFTSRSCIDRYKLPQEVPAMSVKAAEEMIAYVYSTLVPEENGFVCSVQFSAYNSLVSYTQAILQHRYAVRRLATKFSKGLLACCLQNSDQSKRLALFSNRCGKADGVDTNDSIGGVMPTRMQFNPQRFACFHHMIKVLFGNNARSVRATLNSTTQDMRRDVIIAKLPDLLPLTDKTDPELLRFIEFEINSMNVVTTETIMSWEGKPITVEKVNVDDIFAMLLDYVELELHTDCHDIFQYKRVPKSGVVDKKALHLY